MKISHKDIKKLKSSSRTLIYMQPELHEYRKKVFENLNSKYNLIGIFNSKVKTTTIKFLKADSKNPFSILKNTFFLINNRKDFNKSIVFSASQSKDLGIIFSLILFKLFNFKIVINGQSLYKKKRPNLIHWLINYLWIYFSDMYISYTYKGLIGPFKLKTFKNRIKVIENRFENFNLYSIPEKEINKFYIPTSSNPMKLLFIGRDRPNSNIKFLLEALELLQKDYFIELHIIGSFKRNFDSKIIHHYGELHGKEIIKIAKNCSLGVYPGDAGLSILHYMCLGLCPIAHSSIQNHFGPEPLYITNNKNGKLFKRNSFDSFFEILIELYNDHEKLNFLRANAYKFAKDLHKLPYSKEIDMALEEL